MKNVIGNGVVVDPSVLLAELDGLEARDVDTSNLLLSADAHLLMPYHVAIDKVTERFLGNKKIGTTGRGIGPCYQDKIARVGVRAQDVLDESILTQKVEAALEFKNQVLTKIYNRRALDARQVVDETLELAESFKHRIADTRLELNLALERGETVLLEGSQGTLLDVDHGTYPYVTSSNPTSGGASVGSGIGPTRITTVLGILKAYTTRVGSGPFPTELFDEWGEYLAKHGGEVGVTTGRARRCGWFDAVIARYATRVNGITDYFLTKLDVLSSIENVPICVAYEIDGVRYDEMPPNQTDFHHAKPIFETMPGWWEDISGCRTFEDLPKNAQDYVLRLEEPRARTSPASVWARAATRRSSAAPSSEVFLKPSLFEAAAKHFHRRSAQARFRTRPRASGQGSASPRGWRSGSRGTSAAPRRGRDRAAGRRCRRARGAASSGPCATPRPRSPSTPR